MSQEPINPPSPGMSLGDIYYVLFRHKWKIVVISTLGLIVALMLPLLMPRPYQSEAKIFIRYVLETKSPGQMNGGDSRVKSPDEGGGNIINSEIEILTSLDLAQQVADIVGTRKILGKNVGPNDRFDAANLIRKNLMVPTPNKSSVIQIVFKHRDPSVVQPVLNELVESYFKKHAEVHRAVGVFDSLTQETDQLRSRLVQTENALLAAKTNAGVISLEETKRSHSTELSRIRLEIFAAEAELAQRKSAIHEIAKLTNVQVPGTNAAGEKATPVPSDKVAEYRRVTGLLDNLIRREQELSLQFTSDNAQLKGIQEQISASQKIKERLEKEQPGLLAVIAVEQRPAGLTVDPRLDLQTQVANMAALVSKIEALTNQMAQVRRESASIDAVEGSITELQRKRELEETNYKYYAAKLEEARIDEALGAGRASNINKVQAPSPPFRDNIKLIKLMLGTCFGAFALALAWAFLTEFYFDRSIRRPSQIKFELRAPLFLSIPRLKLNGKSHGLNAGKKVPLLKAASQDGETPSRHTSGLEKSEAMIDLGSGKEEIAPWDVRHALRPFYETLRDRLITYCEVNNLTHTPKLVALTSCGEGSGVTTTATGLAACLSETGEGNVLLVDMNLQEGEAHHFYKGHLQCGFDDALTSDKRQKALVQDNLYVVKEAPDGNKTPHLLPKNFKTLLPRLRASDYDYIIFDMPPVSQISATPRLAQFMDMVFLVVESEKTDRDVVKRATALLSESKTNVGIILNKSNAYVPQRLQQEI